MSGNLRDVPASRILLFGCGFTFLLVGLAGAVFLSQADDLLARALERTEEKVGRRLPADLPGEERTRLALAFQDARRALRADAADADALARAQALIHRAVGRPPGETMTRREVAELSEALERVPEP